MEYPAKELYDRIKAIYPDTQTSICEIDKICLKEKRCTHPSQHNVIDFDKIQHLYDKALRRQSTPSVDAVTYHKSNGKFCFIELKGWEKFLYGGYQQDGISLEKIQQTVTKHNLKGKLENTIQTCKAIIKDENLFEKIPFCYILITDINIISNPLQVLASNLMSLSESSSNWNDICNALMQDKLNDIKDVEKYYIHCQDLDNLMEQMS